MCIETAEERETKKINKKIENELKRLKANSRKEVKLLLLGTGESGKSTFMKQMKIIHDNGFSQSELESRRKYVFHNTVICMQRLLIAMKHFGISLDSTDNQPFADRLLELTVTYVNVGKIFPDNYLPKEIVNYVQSLWNDSGVQGCFERRNEFQLSDSAEYFFTNVARFGEVDYLPTYADVVRIRVPTTGIIEHLICIKSVWFRIVDVGGQSNERPKWINCFEGVTSIIFLTALNEYDMFLEPVGSDEMNMFYKSTTNQPGKGRINRMQESLALFKVITRTKLLSESSFILFLNKKDLLEEKIDCSPLKGTFENYNGPPNDYLAAGEFIKEMFILQALFSPDEDMLMQREHSFDANGVRRTDSSSTSSTANSFYRSKNNYKPQISSLINTRSTSVASATNITRGTQSKPIYAHFTCATDTENIKFVFNSVKHAILKNHIDEFFYE